MEESSNFFEEDVVTAKWMVEKFAGLSGQRWSKITGKAGAAIQGSGKSRLMERRMHKGSWGPLLILLEPEAGEIPVCWNLVHFCV